MDCRGREPPHGFRGSRKTVRLLNSEQSNNKGAMEKKSIDVLFPHSAPGIFKPSRHSFTYVYFCFILFQIFFFDMDHFLKFFQFVIMLFLFYLVCFPIFCLFLLLLLLGESKLTNQGSNSHPMDWKVNL